ncbi:MAG: glutathione S-transferase family protein [Steroidobacteraceae bacterium]
MILLGASVSPFVRKVLIVAAEKGVVLEHRPTNPRSSDDPDYLLASPFRKIPALKDGDYTLADSTAIVHYLEAKFPSPAMIPHEARARGKAIWFEEVADTILFAAVSKIFLNRVVMPKFLNKPGNEAEVTEAVTTLLPPMLAYLETVAPASGFLVGDSLSIADISVTSMLVNLVLADATPDPATYPALTAYYNRVAARPSIAKLVAADRAMLGL